MASLLITSTIIPAGITAPAVSAAYGTGKNVVEYLDRGISAINTGSGMHVSWRFLANDPDDAVFKLYRDNNLIYEREKLASDLNGDGVIGLATMFLLLRIVFSQPPNTQLTLSNVMRVWKSLCLLP